MPTTFLFSIVSPVPPPDATGSPVNLFRRGPDGIGAPVPTDISEVPTTTLWDSYSQRTQLSGVEYEIKMQWNERSNAWFFSLFWTDGTPIVQNKKAALNSDLLLAVVDPLRPPGTLVLSTPEPGNFLEPNRDQLGENYNLLYLEY